MATTRNDGKVSQLTGPHSGRRRGRQSWIESSPFESHERYAGAHQLVDESVPQLRLLVYVPRELSSVPPKEKALESA